MTDKKQYEAIGIHWHFGKVAILDNAGTLKSMKGDYVGEDELQRLFKPDMIASAEDATAYIALLLEGALDATRDDCRRILDQEKRPDEQEEEEAQPFTSRYYAEEIESRCDELRNALMVGRSPEGINFERELFNLLKNEDVGKEVHRLVNARMSDIFRNLENAVETALEVGRLVTEAEWRTKHKPSIVTGGPVRTGAKLGGEMRARKYGKSTKKTLEEMGRCIERGQSVRRAAEIVFDKLELGTSSEANRKLWSRHKKKTTEAN